MTTQEMKERFDALYEQMETSKDVSKMRLFGAAFINLFNKVAATSPELAMATLEMLMGIEYNNFVTPAEATEKASHFINDDTSITGSAEPSKGAHWSMDALKAFLTQKGLPLEEKPYYNWPALWLTVNMEYSDYANVMADLLGTKENERLATSIYKLSLKKLKDEDRPRYIRRYFNLEG